MDNKLISWLIISVFAVIVLYFMITTMMGIAEPTVSLESKNFTVNNTNYPVANTPTNNDLILYYYQNTTFPIPTNFYLANTTHVKLYGNSTDQNYPNVSALSIYYYSYTYQKSATVWGMDYNFMGLIVFLGIAIWLSYQLTKPK